eukprot:15432974-Alexandrium_andersonii.AAC.1
MARISIAGGAPALARTHRAKPLGTSGTFLNAAHARTYSIGRATLALGYGRPHYGSRQNSGINCAC